MEQNRSSASPDRKTIEKNRRNRMKAHYSKLNSIIPHQDTRDMVSIPDQLDEAINYIKRQQIKLEKMIQKKERLSQNAKFESQESAGTSRLPQIEIKEYGSALEVVLITGTMNSQFIFTQAIRILHEEGAEVVTASFLVRDNTVFYTMHSEVGISPEGYALNVERISERLKKVVDGAASICDM